MCSWGDPAWCKPLPEVWFPAWAHMLDTWTLGKVHQATYMSAICYARADASLKWCQGRLGEFYPLLLLFFFPSNLFLLLRLLMSGLILPPLSLLLSGKSGTDCDGVCQALANVLFSLHPRHAHTYTGTLSRGSRTQVYTKHTWNAQLKARNCLFHQLPLMRDQLGDNLITSSGKMQIGYTKGYSASSLI